MTGFLIVIAILLALIICLTLGIYNYTFVHKMKDHFDPFIMTDFDKNYYGSFTDEMLSSSKRMEETEHKHVFIKSEDGLRLNGHLYNSFEGRPIVIFFHGYHGSYLRDGYGTFRYCMDHKLNLLMIEQRAHCKSEGEVISFGINERKDACKWVEYVKSIIPKDTKIILAGVSMGAATVMMTSNLVDNDPQILCYIEDCGYTSPKEIIKNTAASTSELLKYCYPLAKLAAKVLGHFDLESASAIESVSKISKPILFIHGSNDGFVPTPMCKILYNACSSENKKMYIIKDAEHAISALVGYDEYEKAVTEFLASIDGANYGLD